MSVILVLLSAIFGAADQYLGSFPAHPWTTEVSLLAAPWLLLPFLIGCTQRTARRACLLALLCVFAALGGFIAMTLSPLEHAKVSLTGLAGLLGWQIRWFVLAATTAPAFGWLGHRWRTHRSLWAPALAAATFLAEPLARTVVWLPIRLPQVRWGEVTAGVVVFTAFALLRGRRSGGL